MNVYRIAKWSDVFETAESRRHKALHWVAMPVGFSSTGYQLLLDEFGDRAAAIYGAWCALVSVAASCAVRGVLCNSRGVPLKVSHIARTTGLQSAVFEDLLRWAAAPEVGWLEEVPKDEALVLLGLKTQQNQGEADSPGDRPGDAQATTGLPNPTLPNPTLPNHQLAAAKGEAAEIDFSRLEWREVCSMASKLQRAVPSLDSEYIWQAAWLTESLNPGFLSEVATKIKTREVRKPQSYIDATIRKECESRGIDLHALKSKIPARPVVNEQPQIPAPAG